MSLIVIVTIVQAVSSTLAWIGFYVGIRALPGARARQPRWIIGSAVVAAAWLVGVLLLGGSGNDVLPPRIPVALGATLLVGYLLLLSPTFRGIVAAVPQHWRICIQAFRILGAVWLVRYFAGQLPGLFALPAGIGDVATGLLAPFVVVDSWTEGADGHFHNLHDAEFGVLSHRAVATDGGMAINGVLQRACGRRWHDTR